MENREVSLRIAKVEDAARLVEIYSSYVLETAVTFETDVPSVAEFERRIKEVLEMYPYLVAEIDGEIAGYAYAHRYRERAAFDWTVEVSIYVDEKFKKHGIGRRLYTELEEILKEQGITNLYACVAEPNGEDPHLTMASPIFHKKMKYDLVGRHNEAGYKFGRWYNLLVFEKFVNEHPDDMKPIRPFNQLKIDL